MDFGCNIKTLNATEVQRTREKQYRIILNNTYMQFDKILDYIVIHDNTSYVLIMEEKQTIVACGAGASTKVVFDNDDGSVRIERVENVKDVTNYCERIDEMIQRKKDFFDNCGKCYGRDCR